MRKTCLMVLSHLILNDMMKVKGHMARLALCLQDADPRVAGLAQVFFHELSRKAFKVGRPSLKDVPHVTHAMMVTWAASQALSELGLASQVPL